jgi:isopentenyl phosphate kinase
MDLTVIKLGGSVITEKDSTSSFNRSLLDEIAEELAEIKTRLLLVHGAGGFGHPIAKEYAIDKGYKDCEQLKGVTETKCSMLSLTLMITQSLADHNIPIVPFMSSSCMVAEAGRLVRIDLEPFRVMLNLGLVPLCSGDVVADLKMGFCIVSGDQIAVRLAEKLDAKRVIFGCDVDGVFDSDPKKNPNAKLIRLITPKSLKKQMDFLGESVATDVTEGMLGKIKESIALVSSGKEVVIINLKRPKILTRFFEGQDVPCTRLIPDNEKARSSQ